MKLQVLVDNNTLIDRYFIGEPGVSYYIEAEGKTVLFDTGYSDVFVKNAEKMGLDLLKSDYIVLSHGHIDHSWGLVPLIRLYSEALIEGVPFKTPSLLAHPKSLLNKSIGREVIGSLLTENQLARHFDMNLSSRPIWITDKLVYLGEIERSNDFEAQSPIGQYDEDGLKHDDYLMDDTALAYKSDQGLVIITGCSHAGICNIIEYAKKVCKDARIIDVIGGFHLLDPEEEILTRTASYFSENGVKKAHACHCTDLKSKIALAGAVEMGEVGVGLVLEYDE